ncbi:hypothetical protein DRE_05205 [Drechslerella stenobrocha 248]|uniref:Uncharacterized protein n=1 Tax=Drechslerella stenobrocha 248 TaxID=1043628 RepID=W7HR34_9PEZI|nr:hypothetical protein DRE_05205 [Drechslerella stenobrocha 248]
MNVIQPSVSVPAPKPDLPELWVESSAAVMASLAQSIPRKRGSETVDVEMSSPKRQRSASPEPEVTTSKPSSPMKSFLNISDDGDSDNHYSDYEVDGSGEEDGDQTPKPRLQTPPHTLVHLDDSFFRDGHSSIPYSAEERPVERLHPMANPVFTNHAYQQYQELLSRTDNSRSRHQMAPTQSSKHTILDDMLQQLIQNAEAMVAGSTNILRDAQAMKRDTASLQTILAVELCSRLKISHINDSGCLCGASTAASIINLFFKGPPAMPDPETPPHATINENGSKTTKAPTANAGFKRGSSWGAPFKLLDGEERLLKQAIRELALPVDELAVLVGKRYENLNQDSLLRPIPPEIVEIMLREYGYGRTEE